MWAQLVDGSQVSVTHCDAVHVDAHGAKFEVKLKNGRLEVPFSPASPPSLLSRFTSLPPSLLPSSLNSHTLVASGLVHY